MDLAAHLGMTVGRLLREMTLREFARWQKKWNEEPWGEYRADLRSAQICAMLANVNRDSKKHPEPFKIDAFLLFKREPELIEERSPGANAAPETVAWLYAISEKHKTNPPEPGVSRGN